MKLTHGQQVRITGAVWSQAITVGTVEGYARQYNENPVEAVKREASRGYALAWTNLEPGCLSSGHPGKAAAIATKKAAFDSATVLEDGMTVEIEGRQYAVKIMGLVYSDPIHFIPVAKHKQPPRRTPTARKPSEGGC